MLKINFQENYLTTFLKKMCLAYFQDILKKNGLTYKGRIDMDDCSVVWLNDGEGKRNGSCFRLAVFSYRRLSKLML